MGQKYKKILAQSKYYLDFIIGLASVLLGIVYYILTYQEATGESDFSLSPAFFPRLAAILLIGLGILLSSVSLVSNKKKKVAKKKRSSQVEGSQAKPILYVLLTIAIMVSYIYLIEWIGFIIATAITLGGMMVLYGSRRWFVISLVSLALPISIYYFTFKVMFVLFPSGTIFK